MSIDTAKMPALNAAKMEAFVGQVVSDMAASMSGVMSNLGHKLGLYQAMAGVGPITAPELALKTNLHERYVLEWLNNQAAGGYVIYDAERCTYELPNEHAAVLVDAQSPVFLAPGFQSVSAMWLGEEKLTRAFQTGQGIGWHEQHPSLFCGCEAFYRTSYQAHLVSHWIPALTGVAAKLNAGARVADVGCGHGASAIILAQAYPQSHIYGFDYHNASIAVARQRAAMAGVSDRVHFEVASAKTFAGQNFDLICYMDCLHDMGDPLGALVHARRAIAPNGSLLIVEPLAGNHIQDNLSVVGRLFYAASTAFCTPNALSQEVGLALGAQAGAAKVFQLLQEAGFSQCRIATQTSFNLILEALP